MGLVNFSLSAFADVARTLKKMLSESGYSNRAIGLSDLLDKANQTARRVNLHGTGTVEVPVIDNPKIQNPGYRSFSGSYYSHKELYDCAKLRSILPKR